MGEWCSANLCIRLEAQIKRVETDIASEQNAEESLVEDMSDDQRKHYVKLKKENTSMASVTVLDRSGYSDWCCSKLRRCNRLLRSLMSRLRTWRGRSKPIP